MPPTRHGSEVQIRECRPECLRGGRAAAQAAGAQGEEPAPAPAAAALGVESSQAEAGHDGRARELGLRELAFGREGEFLGKRSLLSKSCGDMFVFSWVLLC